MAPWRDVLCHIFSKSCILPAEVQERGEKSDTKTILGVVLMSGYVLWVEKRGEMGQAALETARIVSNYIFETLLVFTARYHIY